MTAQIISVGDELLIGQVVNTNTADIGQALTSVGVPVIRTTVVGDGLEEIAGTIREAMSTSEIVIVTGGLGPTKDDKTVEALGQLFESPLVFSEETWKRLNKIFARFGRQPTESHRQQCFMPQAAQLLNNNMGTAPGMHFERDGAHVFVMPGVPYEMRYILDHHIIPMLQDGFADLAPIVHRTICTVGEGESRLANHIADIEENLPEKMQLAYLPRPGRVRIRVMSRSSNGAQEEVDKVATQIADRVQEFVFAMEDITLSEAIGQLLQERNLKLSVAESCTGGLIGHILTSISGSSRYFVGGAITYSNALKMQVLGVQHEVLEQHGAVSEETACQMSTGAVLKFNSDVAVAVTGIAGPDGGSEEKPVGTVWISVSSREEVIAEKFTFSRDRARNIELSAVFALNMLRKFLTRT